jgi:hypothetical protein
VASTQDASELDALADLCGAQSDVAGTVEHARAAAKLQPFECCYSQENPTLVDRKRIDPRGKGQDRAQYSLSGIVGPLNRGQYSRANIVISRF